MTYKEIEKEDRCEVAYMYLISKMNLYKETLSKITLYRRKNKSGRTVSNITCYLCDSAGNVRTLFFRLYDEEYLWFCTAVASDFPELDFEDLTADEDKGGATNDTQTSEET